MTHTQMSDFRLCAEVEVELQGKPHPECQAIKEAMLACIRSLALPGNFLWWSHDL